MLVLFERIRSLETAPDLRLGRLWPNLAVFIHGGVRMHPYRGLFEDAIGRPIHYVEVYPASEAFVAIQVHATDPGLTLMLDYGNFYEFVPVAELGSPSPRRLNIAEIRVGESYAVLLTTPAGLWSYVLGDTVRFVSFDPPQLVITGRTSQFVNAFGENVIVEEGRRPRRRRARAPTRNWSSSPWRPSTRGGPRSLPVTSGRSSFAPVRRASRGSRTRSTTRSRRSTPTTGPSARATSGWRPRG